MKKTYFEKTGGFIPDINGDGLMGGKLTELGRVKFSNNAKVFISARRFQKMGFFKFSTHYFYVIENFLPILRKTSLLKILKKRSGEVHSKMRLSNRIS